MKKILATVAATIAAGFAFAAPSWSTIYTTAYDSSPSIEKRANYTAYYCTEAAASAMFGGADSLAGIEKYLAANFATGKSAMGGTAGSYALRSGDYGAGQYQFIEYFADQIAEGHYFAVAFYQDEAFRVFESTDVDNGNLTFDDSIASTAGDWTIVSVPEPTSGLLMLLGLAGLALKRRRA